MPKVSFQAEVNDVVLVCPKCGWTQKRICFFYTEKKVIEYNCYNCKGGFDFTIEITYKNKKKTKKKVNDGIIIQNAERKEDSWKTIKNEWK